MTVSPLPGQIKRSEVLNAAKTYAPPTKPTRVEATLLILAGAVLFLVSIGVMLFF